MIAAAVAVGRLVDLISSSPVVQRHCDDGVVDDWGGLLADASLSSGELLVAKLAFRLGRQAGVVEWGPGGSGPDERAGAMRVDVLDVLNYVDDRYSAAVLDALACFYLRRPDTPALRAVGAS